MDILHSNTKVTSYAASNKTVSAQEKVVLCAINTILAQICADFFL
jgi:hypothetical protein